MHRPGLAWSAGILAELAGSLLAPGVFLAEIDRAEAVAGAAFAADPHVSGTAAAAAAALRAYYSDRIATVNAQIAP